MDDMALEGDTFKVRAIQIKENIISCGACIHFHSGCFIFGVKPKIIALNLVNKNVVLRRVILNDCFASSVIRLLDSASIKVHAY